MLVRYASHEKAWGFVDFVENLIRRVGARTVCEVGGGANPALGLDFLRTEGIDYTVLDISEEELAKAPSGYRKLQGDAASSDFVPPTRYELVLSRMVAEHVRQPEQFHRNVNRMLVDGGRATHFFPTLYALPFTFNRLAPEAVSEPLLRLVQTGREESGSHGKFPAYYRWCRGPTRRQLERFWGLGFDVEEYVGFFGHGYFTKVPWLQAVEDRLAAALVRHPAPLLTSYAYVVLRKPARVGERPYFTAEERNWGSNPPCTTNKTQARCV
jgi:SAM-dependent methyltransferase